MRGPLVRAAALGTTAALSLSVALAWVGTANAQVPAYETYLRRLVVSTRVELPGEPQPRSTASAVLIGVRGTTVFALTAGHHARTAGQLLVRGPWEGDTASYTAAVDTSSDDLDVALIAIAGLAASRRWQTPYVLGPSADEPGFRLRVAGCPDQRCLMVEDARLDREDGTEVHIRSPYVGEGFSGGLVVTEGNRPVGLMATGDASGKPIAIARSWQAVVGWLERVGRSDAMNFPILRTESSAAFSVAARAHRGARDPHGHRLLPDLRAELFLRALPGLALSVMVASVSRGGEEPFAAVGAGLGIRFVSDERIGARGHPVYMGASLLVLPGARYRARTLPDSFDLRTGEPVRQLVYTAATRFTGSLDAGGRYYFDSDLAAEVRLSIMTMDLRVNEQDAFGVSTFFQLFLGLAVPVKVPASWR